MARSVTWSMVRPSLDAELEDIKEALLTAPAHEIHRLQERARALLMVRRWFEDDPGEDRKLSDDVKY